MRAFDALIPHNGVSPAEDGVSWKDKLRKVLFLAMLGMGGVLGATMNPKEIEDLMRLMNQTQIEVVVKQKSGDGDQKISPEDAGNTPP